MPAAYLCLHTSTQHPRELGLGPSILGLAIEHGCSAWVEGAEGKRCHEGVSSQVRSQGHSDHRGVLRTHMATLVAIPQ